MGSGLSSTTQETIKKLPKKVVFKFELEQSVNISMFQTDENHHWATDSIPSTKESITQSYKENSEYVYITVSQPINV